jgi:hypothetical protein
MAPVRRSVGFRLVMCRRRAELLRELAGRVFSNRRSYVLRLDTTMPLAAPRARISIRVRPLCSADVPLILTERPVLDPILRSGLSGCYVCTTSQSEICHTQWLIGPSQNRLVADEFAGLCPALAHDETIVGWAYTFRRFEGLGIMADALAQVCQIAATTGAHWVYSFVDVDDRPTVELCRKIGFQPHQVRTDSWRLFCLTSSFEHVTKPSKYFSRITL